VNMVQSFARSILVEGENILGSNWNASIQIKRAESCDPVVIQPSEPNLASKFRKYSLGNKLSHARYQSIKQQVK
jgi:hypothetical protein